MVPDPHLIIDPETLLMDVVADTHYLPNEWRGAGLHSDNVFREFSNLFEYRLVLFVQELLSIILAPFVLAISLPPCAAGIVDFFREFTVHVDSVGYVCSFAVFNFNSFNDSRGRIPTASSAAAPTKMTSSKMEQSIMNFRQNWEGPGRGPGASPELAEENELMPIGASVNDENMPPSPVQPKLINSQADDPDRGHYCPPPI
jgi:autophagy-related protein 9